MSSLHVRVQPPEKRKHKFKYCSPFYSVAVYVYVLARLCDSADLFGQIKGFALGRTRVHLSFSGSHCRLLKLIVRRNYERLCTNSV